MSASTTKNRVDQAARSFDAELHTPEYRQTHADTAQLIRLLSYLPNMENPLFVDLGTGNGYVATAMAEARPKAAVLGLDVAQKAISENRALTARRGLNNLSFLPIDGIHLPVDELRAAAVVSRYMFHHLPEPDVTVGEIHRILKKGGVFILSDAVRDEHDDVDFINRFQALKPDGHIRMHRGADLVYHIRRHGFDLVATFESAIRFSRPTGPDYEALLTELPEQVTKAYQITREENVCRLCFPIFNGVFVKLDHPIARELKRTPQDQ